jgi:hypothetical protein
MRFWTTFSGIPGFLYRREQPLAGAELLAEQDEIRPGRRVLQVGDYRRLLGGVPGVEVLDQDERLLPEERVGVARGDDCLGARLGGVVSLDLPAPAQPLHAAGLALLVVAQKQIDAHECILDACGTGKTTFCEMGDGDAAQVEEPDEGRCDPWRRHGGERERRGGLGFYGPGSSSWLTSLFGLGRLLVWGISTFLLEPVAASQGP